MTRAEIDRKLDEIVAFSGVEKHIDTPVKWYSSGMYVRLAFAVAAHLEPEILVIDEVLAVGDAEFQKKCLQRMSDVVEEGRTILFVSHNLQIVRRLCARAILLEEGQLIADGETDGVIQRYLTSIDSDNTGVRSWHDKPLGDAACRFHELRVTDADGAPGATFFTSKPIYVTLEFDVDELSPVLNIGFELATADGVVVFATYFRDVPDQQALRLRPGRNALRCEIPDGLLNSGRYMINLHASIHGVRFIVHADAVLHFDVILDHGDSLFLSTASRAGVIAPQVAWDQVDPVAVPAHAASR
jgi:lipopolysaccharide transport system ATP-binding protein